jgi:hypothetical protein
VLVEVRLAYLSQERHLDFRHRQAKLGSIAVNSMQYGPGIMVTAPPFGDFYLLQFTLTGRCQLRQDGRCTDLPAGSVAVINPFRPFAKAWAPGTRQLLIRINRRLLEREFQAWTGSDKTERIEFDLSPVESMARVGTLTHYVRMLCDDLSNESSHLEHPLVCDRIASALISTLLVSMPHNRGRDLEAAATSIAPFFVRRVEHFIEENARCALSSRCEYESVAAGFSSISKHNANGVLTGAPIGVGTQRIGPSRARGRLRRLSRKCLRVRAHRSIRGRLPNSLRRVTLPNASARQHWTSELKFCCA